MTTTPDNQAPTPADDDLQPVPEAMPDPQRLEAEDRDSEARDVEPLEAEEESRLATHKDPTLAEQHEPPGGGGRSRVEWVRPTDLAARAGTRVMERGQDLNRQLMAAVKEAARQPRENLRQRLAARSTEVSISTPEQTPARTAGREGVGR